VTDPSLIHAVDATGPVTHAFIVGMGDYPHLKGGSGARAIWDFNLGQLTSTTASARRIASWLIENFECPHRPLASVRLVLSEPGNAPASFRNPSSGETFEVPRGTRLETRDALLAALRAVTDPDDQLLFYFAGHGLAGGVNNFYLLRDFGSDPNGPLDNMIKYSVFMAALGTQMPTQQMLVFDGCRDVDEKVEANRMGGSGLIPADPGIRSGIEFPVLQCSILSAERDSKSYGPRGRPSVCAQAFERALDGAAGKSSRDGWIITSGRLCEAMADFQTLGFGPNSGIVQRPDPAAYKDFPLRGLAGPPRVPVFMQRRDGQSLEGAQVTCTALNGQPTPAETVEHSYWEGRLPIGFHSFDVVLADQSRCRTVEDAVSPTHLPIDLDVEVP